MSDDPASYAFLPWLRRGIASAVDRPDGAMTGAARAAVPITLGLDAAGERREVTADIELHGPGEVVGLDPRVVIRTVPKPDEADAEPNYFPAVEFAQPDLPWRFVPARADDADRRLRPWLVLAVLTQGEIAEESPALGDGTLPSITVASADSLPSLSQSWAWAHTQVDGFDAASETLAGVVAGSPQRVRSRLVAARRLDPRTAYRAFVVPAFERGRRAGLREPLDDTVDGLAPAWEPGAQRVRLPVYYAWSFQTGERGDFESLVRLLKARAVDGRVGMRDMDVSAPDPALPAAASGPLAMEGALTSTDAAGTAWEPAERAAFTAALADLLNRQSDALATPGVPLTVAPPLWVRWQAAADRLDTAAGAEPVWFHELNSDPRLRAVAGLGAEVVRGNDQQLMAEAWEQVAGILEANAELRRSQVSREASERLLDRHLAPLDAETFLTVTAPLHSRFTLSAHTVHHALERSPVPAGALDGALRRVARPAGPIGRRMRRLRSKEGRAGLIDRLNRGDARPRPPDPPPGVMVTRGRAEGRLPDAPGRDVRATRPPPDFVPAASTPGEWTKGPVPPKDLPAAEARKAAGRFKAAAAELMAEVDAPPAAGRRLVPVDLTGVAGKLEERMSPALTIVAGVEDRLAIADWVAWDYDDPLEPIMAAPHIDTPMYEPLRDMGQDWLMPGVDRIPPDTATLLKSNQRFIEAYMAGLSHEMARELLYHEFPTDQRGTYFKQFWDVRGAIAADGSAPDPETLRDIDQIHEWGPTTPLGEHTGRQPPPREGHVVLLVKGEVLRRYPSTMVYAIRTTLGSDGRRTLGSQQSFPVFEGRLDPDLSFFGFDLLPEEVRGDPDPAADQGWYFVLQEQPTEPVFGLDADDGRYAALPASWNDLNWAQLATGEDELRGLGHVDLDAELPDTTGIVPAADEASLAWHAESGRGATGSNSSDLAYITLQRPFRVAIHGSDMLPPAEGP